MWTNDIETALKNEGLVGVKKYYDQICAELLETVSMVAKFRNHKLKRLTLNALIVIDVHA